jgi:hypothetical protein
MKERQVMSERRPVRWELVVAVIVLAIVVFWLLVTLSPSVSWPAWTGFVDFTTPKSDAFDYHPARTLWDWLGLLVVPAVLVIGGYFFTRSERASDNAIAERRIAEDRKIAEEQRIEDRRREDDRIRDALLREYLDRMSDLLITHELGSSKEGEPQRLVARARTVTVLNALGEDGARKGNIVRFLYEAKLLNKDNPVVNLKEADLRHADLTGVNLSGVNLSWANLGGADLGGAHLSGADLRGVNLSEAHLIEAYLIDAQLSRADLGGADLSRARLSEADLSWADLSGANLSWAHLDRAELFQAVLINAILKDARVTRKQLENAVDWERAILPEKIKLMDIKP